MPYPLFLYSGLIVWIFVQNSITRAASSLASSRGLMDKIYFPRAIIPLVQIGANALDLLMAGLVILLLVFYYAFIGPALFNTEAYVPRPGYAILLLPAFLLLLALFVVAVALLMAVWQVYSTDVGLVLPVALRLGMYLSPVVYPVERVPAAILPYYFLNPVAVILESFRWTLFGSSPPPLPHVLWTVGLTLILLVVGLATFRRVERSMVDIL
jgi:lipopolysaccharide transport system permease protein